jgi:uncharacterized repeat protein (TIGR04138 family)
MDGNDFRLLVEEIYSQDKRFKPDSYEFVMQALEYTQKTLKRSGHVSGRELAEGMREFALKLYGPMAKVVLNHWGIRATADFGTIVFTLIGKKVLSRTESDAEADFANVYDFGDAFKPVLKNITI